MKPALSVEDVLRLVLPSNVRVSSRGDMAFTVSRSDLDKNRNYTEVHVVRSDGSRAFLVGEGDGMPRWSPEGRLLAFTSRRGAGKEEKGTGVYLWSGLGEPRKIAWFKHGVRSLTWLDENTLLAVVPTPREGLYDVDGDYVVVDRLPAWFDREGLIAGLAHSLLLMDAWSGKTETLAVSINGIASTEACRGKIFYAVPMDWRDPTKHRLMRLDPAGRAAETVLEGYSISTMTCLEDQLYALMHRGEIGIASHYKLWIIDQGPKCLTCGLIDRNIRSIVGKHYGDPLILYEDSGASVLAMVSEKVRPLTGAREYVHEAHAEAGIIGFIASSPTKPPEVYVLRGDKPVKITMFNEWLAENRRLMEPRRIVVEHKGEKIEGWVMLPEGRDHAPLILYIHGGPKGMYGYYFHPEIQLMAAQGFAVAYANPHGSTGYSEEFADIRGRYGDKDYEQLITFLDEVLEKYDDVVDKERIAVTGISYGGYMTNIMVTKTSRFKAAVSENGIGDWIADYWASDIGYWFDPDQIGGTPHDNLGEYLDKSPAFHVDSVKTPVLFIHSLQDYRCFVDQALAMHVSLAIRGKDTTLLLFTKGSHGHSRLAEPRHRRKRYEYKIKWLKEKLSLVEGETR